MIEQKMKHIQIIFFHDQDGSDGTHLVASAKQVSKATAQLVLACQVRERKII